MISPERGKDSEVVERVEDFTVPESLKDTGIEVVERAFKARVKDKNGQNLIQTPATSTINIQLPSDQATLTTQAKGSTTNSLTWLASFWLRMIKKAMHFGWKITGKGNSK